MSTTIGVCTNFGGCSTADQKTMIRIEPGADFACPECKLSLSLVPHRGPSRRAIAISAVALIGVSLVGALVVVTRRSDSAVAAASSSSDSSNAQVGSHDSFFRDTALQSTKTGALPPMHETSLPRRAERSVSGASAKSTVPQIEYRGAPVVGVAPTMASLPVSPPPSSAAVPGTSVSPSIVAASAPVDLAKVPAAPAVTLARRSSINARPDSSICESTSRVGDAVEMRLLEALTLSDGSQIPDGTIVSGRITGKTLNGGQSPLIQVEATSVRFNGKLIPIETNPFAFYMKRPSAMGRVAKGAILGAVAGAAVGLILRQNVIAAAGIGAAAGGAVGAVVPKGQACVSPTDSRFVFTLTRETPFQ